MNRLKSLKPILFFLIGFGIFFYPTVANSIAIYQQVNIIHDYDSKVKEESDTGSYQLLEEAEIYNQNLERDSVHDPFIFNSEGSLPNNYFSVLNIGEKGVMGYIEIPNIDVNLPIYHGTSDEVLSRGVGHIEGTSLPIGGNFRHSVLCAHRGLPSAKLFTRLNELKKGDLFYIIILGDIHAYKVDKIDTVLPEEIPPYLNAEDGKDWVTLMTCTPYGVNSHRLLVRGTRTEYIPPQEKKEEKVPVYLVGWIVLLLVLLLIIMYVKKRKKRNV